MRFGAVHTNHTQLVAFSETSGISLPDWQGSIGVDLH